MNFRCDCFVITPDACRGRKAAGRTNRGFLEDARTWGMVREEIVT